jgi:DNA (cytosine-5)-methyltransferase 1
MLHTLDLFSGIGGHAWALRRVLKTIGYCEICPEARAVIRRNASLGNIESAPVFCDVTRLRAVDLSKVPTVITASFPCQDISSAGNGAGVVAGKRSRLFFEVLRIVDEIGSRVKLVYLENVPLIRTRGLDTVVKCLRRRGFDLAWGYFSAAEVGAPHLRRRWYLLARRGLSIVPFSDSPDTDFHEREPRLIRLQKRTARKEKQRMQLLGNAIVPDTCRFAWNCLAKVLNGEPDAIVECVSNMQSTVYFQKATSQHVRYFSRPNAGRYQALCLCVDGTSQKSWITPVHSLSHMSPQTYAIGRMRNMFATQVFHERGTKTRFRYAVVNAETKHKWLLNPAWVEEAMGFPVGWTKH